MRRRFVFRNYTLQVRAGSSDVVAINTAQQKKKIIIDVTRRKTVSTAQCIEFANAWNTGVNHGRQGDKSPPRTWNEGMQALIFCRVLKFQALYCLDWSAVKCTDLS